MCNFKFKIAYGLQLTTYSLLLTLLFLVQISFAGIIHDDLKTRLTKLSVEEKITVIVWMKENKELQMVPQTISDRTQAVLKAQSIVAKTHADISQFLEDKIKTKHCTHYLSLWLFNALSVTADKDTIEEISRRSDVEKVIPNYTITLPPQPSLEISPQGISPLADSPWGVTKIRADKVRDYVKFTNTSIDGNGILVGHLDTGTTVTHSDLVGKISATATFNSQGDKSSDTAEDDATDSHGTHTCGNIVGGNASGEYIGVAPGAKLLVAKVFVAGSATMAQVMGGGAWCIGNGANIINASLGTDEPSTDTSWIPSIERVVNEWGVIPVISIGNEGQQHSPPNTTSPGNIPSAFGVGSTNTDDSISNFSSQGPVIWAKDTYNTLYEGSYIKPDITAPGNSIKSSSKNGNYRTLSGTSQAAPHVTGTAALALQALKIQSQTLTASALKSILESSAIDLGTSGKDNTFGAGRLDAFNAVCKADLTAPTIAHTQVRTAEAGTDIPLTAEVSDNLAVSDSNLAVTPVVTIYYRVTGASSWSTTVMTKTTGNTYSGTIPLSSVTTAGVDYYIQAQDLKPNSVSSAASEPNGYHHIGVSDTTAPTITSQSVITNDYISSSSTISFTLNDGNGSGVNSSTISITIKDQTGATLGTYTTSTSPAVSFNSATGAVALTPSNITFETGKTYSIDLSAKDYNNNTLSSSVSPLSGPLQTLSITDFMAFPNPFAPDGTTTKGITFGFQNSSEADCTVNIYNVAGKLIKRIASHVSAGYVNSIIWDGKDDSGEIIANGVYLYSFKSQDTSGNVFNKRGRIAVIR